MAASSDDPFYAGLAAGERFPQRRTAPRYFLAWEVEVFEPTQRNRFAAQTNVVSAKGCSINTTVPLQPKTVVRLQIKWREEVAQVWARVTGAPVKGMLGLAFLGNKHEDLFTRWIKAEIEPGPASSP